MAYLLEMETTDKVLLLGTKSNLDIADIDCNDRDAQLCTVYAQDIYNNLRVAEVFDVDSVLLSTFFSIFHMAFLLMVSVNKGKNKRDTALIALRIQGSNICSTKT